MSEHVSRRLGMRILGRIRFGPDAHWRYEGSTSRAGYPVARFEGKVQRVGRLLVDLYAGDPRQANHEPRCGQKWCIAPHHHYIGDQAANLEDARVAGTLRPRPPRGERHWKVTRPFADVVRARAMRARGARFTDIAKQFDVDPSTVRYWCLRRNRKTA